MLTLKRTDSSDADFLKLVVKLDKELWEIYGDVQAQYAPHNKLIETFPAVVAYENDFPIACGCFKKINDITVEVKRMFTLNEHRGKGIAYKILSGLEQLAKEQGFTSVILETGDKQLAAIVLYKKSGYKVTENYEPYIGMPASICMKKDVS